MTGAPGAGPAPGPAVLVAGIGNVFLADDGFGPAVAAELLRRPLPDHVQVADFGIRGMDLAYRITAGCAAVILVDAVVRGEAPGTLTVLEPQIPDDTAAGLQTHAMDPVRVLALARRLAAAPAGPLPRVLLVGCEPLVRMTGAEPDVRVELSEPVARAVPEAAGLVLSLLPGLLPAAGPVRAGEPAAGRVPGGA
ncbi:hydrogenase maturation protease [Streptomyces aidingensis]|uniref:Hydrogenase maturation protease n=1 Tax=Streptomyces aidingensis TaxID=910347 RepID=A0A1I1P9I3_9ACTN|nr:hydrogenase maturation protease [Streptomyces aidingensis]SFD06469.1 hydrogenase maturation protease [Streptomyces aidingensis]